jgi:hypothetical protein
MAKLAFDATDAKMRGTLRRDNWCLCVGAGTCIGFMPSWATLTVAVLNEALGLSLSEESFRKLVADSGWGFDAWIQTALNRHIEEGKPLGEFFAVLESALYGDLRRRARAKGLERALVTAFHNPHLLTREEFEPTFAFLGSLPGSVNALSRLLVAGESQDVKPNAVLTFSYDTVLETLVRMRQVQARSALVGRYEFPPKSFRRVTGPGVGTNGMVPFVHVHGCVTPRSSRSRRAVPHDSRDSIVGPERDYVALAGTSFSWSQTTFLNFALNDALAIVGHSLADPNLRRWLSWAADLRSAQASKMSEATRLSLPHVWIRARPSVPEHQIALEHSVSHLGVRIAWIDEWTEIEAGLSNLLAIDAGRVPKQRKRANNRLQPTAAVR